MSTMDGGFAPPVFNCVGDPYVEKGKILPGHGFSKGKKQFLTSPPKRGQTANAVGYGPLEFKRLYDNEKFEDPHKKYVRTRLKSRSAFRTPNGFRYSSPMKASSSQGDLQGTFQLPGSESPDAPKNRVRVTSSPFTKFQDKNIMTSPGRRGGYGVPGVLLGGNIEYAPSDYDVTKKIALADAVDHKARTGDRKPFNSTSGSKECFDSNDHCGASKVFSMDGVTLRPQSPMEEMSAKEKAELRNEEGLKVFKPSSPHKHCSTTTHTGVLNPFPEHIKDPLSPRALRRAQTPLRRQPVKNSIDEVSEPLRDRKAFRPSSGPRTMLTRPVMVGARVPDGGAFSG